MALLAPAILGCRVHDVGTRLCFLYGQMFAQA